MTITNYTNIIPGISFVSNNKINLIVISDYKSIALPTELQGHKRITINYLSNNQLFFFK